MSRVGRIYTSFALLVISMVLPPLMVITIPLAIWLIVSSVRAGRRARAAQRRIEDRRRDRARLAAIRSLP